MYRKCKSECIRRSVLPIYYIIPKQGAGMADEILIAKVTQQGFLVVVVNCLP